MQSVKGRILVVDDSPEIRRTLRRGLRLRGYDVVEAEGGEQGLRACLHEGPFCAVISDRDMPRVGGAALLHHLRQLDNQHARRFIFHSDNPQGLEAYSVPVVQTKLSFTAIEAALAQL